MERAIADLKDIKKFKLRFDLEDRGDISYYLGINYAKTIDSNLKLTQPQLTVLIKEEVGVDRIIISKYIPEAFTEILHQ